jgi:hypothetical protein
VSVLDWLYSLAQPFVWHPTRALLVSLALALLAFGLGYRRGRLLLLAAAGWGVFALLELIAWRERADIRVDLLVTWPLLCLLTVGCVVAWLRGLVKPGRPGNEKPQGDSQA